MPDFTFLDESLYAACCFVTSLDKCMVSVIMPSLLQLLRQYNSGYFVSVLHITQF